MKYKIPYFIFLTLLFPTTQTLLGNFEFLNDLFYDTTKSYSEGDSVVLEGDPSEIFTALTDVPPGNPPAVGTQSQFWSSSDDYTNDLTSENSDDISTIPPSNFDTTTPGTTPSEGPSFPESTESVNFSENSTESVATIFANFADSYQISSEKDGSLFTLDPSSLQLTFIDSPDYETPNDEDGNNVYELVIVASSGTSGSTDSQTISVTVENVIEAPVFDDGSSATVDFTSGATGPVYTASASDADSYGLGGEDYDLFTINSVTGEISAESITYTQDGDNTYSISINATNLNNESTTFILTVIIGPEETSSEAKLSNLSTRGYVGTADSRMIAGFIVTGSGSTTVTIRALGPTIADAPYKVAGTISDPKLTIVGPSGVIATVDNWQDDSSASDIQSAGRAPSYASEAAVQISVGQGNYTAIVSGVGGATGVALVEVYDEGTGGSTIELSNLSTRAFTGTGDSRMIAGFIVGGETGSSSTVTIRALGPTIADAPYNVAGTISDPRLTIVGPSGVIAIVDNWEQSASAQNIISSSRNPKYTFESAHQFVVAPGNYTAIVQGNNETGISLVEVYKE